MPADCPILALGSTQAGYVPAPQVPHEQARQQRDGSVQKSQPSGCVGPMLTGYHRPWTVVGFHGPGEKLPAASPRLSKNGSPARSSLGQMKACTRLLVRIGFSWLAYALLF